MEHYKITKAKDGTWNVMFRGFLHYYIIKDALKSLDEAYDFLNKYLHGIGASIHVEF